MVKPGAAQGFHVLLVTLDTTRRDALGCYGNRRAVTPAIDSLIAHGVRFDDAVTSVPLTLPAHATLLTGLDPPSHGVRNNGTHRLSEDHVTLAETLRARGYDTAAFVASFVLDARFGVGQGFDIYDTQVARESFNRDCVECNERRADAVTDAALAWLRGRAPGSATKPFFAWVHYYDPHAPYDSPLTSRPAFSKRPYDAEVAFVDLHFKRLLDGLDQLRLRERTLLIVVSDHGESLGSCSEPNHGMLLHGCTTNVAFILSCPALFNRGYRVADRTVGLVDVRPTIEDLLGLTVSSPCDGQSLARASADETRVVYMETLVPLYTAGWSAMHGVQRPGEKFIRAPEPEYYDLHRDPNETRNRFAEHLPAAAALEQELARLMDRWGAAGGAAANTHALSAAEIERLRSLGYVGWNPVTDAENLPDPKAMMGVYNLAARAQRLQAERKYAEALPLAEEAVEQSPTFTGAREVLANLYLKLGRAEDAATTLREGFDLNPSVFMAKATAEALLMLNRYDEVEEMLAKGQVLDPGSGELAIVHGDSLAKQGRPQEARRWYERAIEMDGTRVGVVARERIAKLELN